MFLQVSVILFMGRGVSQHPLQVSRPTPRGGGEVEGSGLEGSLGPHPEGVSRPTPGGEVSRSTSGGLQAHTLGRVSRPTPRGVSQHTLRQTPPNRRLLMRAVRILLEYILVYYCKECCKKLIAIIKDQTY